MGQKVHPRSLRLGIIQDWDSTWFADGKNYAQAVMEDQIIRKHLKAKLKSAMVSKIVIERKAQKLIVKIITGRPGVVVSRGGQGIDLIRKELQALTNRKDIQVDVVEVDKVDLDAMLVAESICAQLEKRVAFRRAMKQAMQRTLRSGAKGVKVMISGRLAGADIARTEWAKEGRIPLHTFRADIDYAHAEAMTLFGIIGVKVWVFKNEVLPGEKAQSNVKVRFAGQDNEGQSGPQEGLRGRSGRGGNKRGAGGGGQRRSGQVKTYRDENMAGNAQQAAQAPSAESQNTGSEE